MSEHKVPAGWATPEAPKPREFRGSVWAGFIALSLVGAGIAWVILSGQEEAPVDVHTNVDHAPHGDHRKSDEHREPDDDPDDPNDPRSHIIAGVTNGDDEKSDAGLIANPAPEDPAPEDPAPEDPAPEVPAPEDSAEQVALDDSLALDIDVLPIDRATQKWLTRANEHLKAERYKSAIFDFRRVLKIDKNVAVAHRGIGIAYARLNKPQYARKAYQRYLKLDPDAEDAPDVRRLLGQ